jgi:hypothetical protein
VEREEWRPFSSGSSPFSIFVSIARSCANYFYGYATSKERPYVSNRYGHF